MRFFVYIWLSLLTFLGSNLCKAENIDVFSNDTAWVVNYKYSPLERDTFHFNLSLPKADEFPEGIFKECSYVRIFWGIPKGGVEEHTDVISKSDLPKEFSYKYPTGSYLLTIRYYKNAPTNITTKADTAVRLQIFNQDLLGHISLQGTPGCIERGVDTFYVKMTDYQGNPPGTKYAVEVRTDAPPKEGFWKVKPDQTQMKDSAVVIFSGPTGTFGADIRFRMTYKESSTSTQLKTNTTEWKTAFVYQKPNIREIFNFRDTLIKGEDIDVFKKIEICTNEELKEMDYDSLVNVKYAYSDNLPMYRLRANFKVEYYRKDSIKQADWKLVTTDTALVDTSNMKFKYPGFYKIKMYAHNECGADSLSTDSIRKSCEKRHIQVYQGGHNVLKCLQDTLCGMPEGGQEIAFMDTGKRFEWDPVPEYKVIVTQNIDGVADKDTIELASPLAISYYKEDLIFNPGVLTNFGCDSTLLKIKLNKTGIYNVYITRSRYCDPPVESTFTITIGDIPRLPVDTLWKRLGTVKGEPLYTCGQYDFTLPEVVIDSNYLKVDSVRWFLQKGDAKVDTLLQTYGVEKQYVYDSIGDVKNYMTLGAHNFCGWSEPEKAELYTNLTPRLKLLRDSLADNDTLCLNVPYKYYWEGKLPDSYKITGKWSNTLTVNKAQVSVGDEADIAASDATKIGVLAFTSIGVVHEELTIQNNNNINCKQVILDTMTVLTIPDALIYDSVRYCINQAKVETEVLFNDNPPALKHVAWKWNNGSENTYLQENYNQSFTLSHSKKDTLYARLSNSQNCYLNDSVVFIPQAEPELVLSTDNDLVCADDTIAISEYTGYIQSSNVGSVPGMHLRVYRNKVHADSLLFDTVGTSSIEKEIVVNRKTPGSFNLIYEVKNDQITEGWEECSKTETLTVKVSKPWLRISKNDTIRDLNPSTYKINVPIDTAGIFNKKIEWSVLSGGGSFDNISELQPIYTLAPADKAKDSLVFTLSGKTLCGKNLTDTLIVYLPKTELWAHRDTICSDNTGYILWGADKTFGKFVNTTTLAWRLLTLEHGSLTSATGKDVKYIPSATAYQADSVQIEIIAWNLYDVAQSAPSKKDTVVLKVNHALQNIYPDILYLKAETPQGRKILFDDIQIFRDGISNKSEAYCQGITWAHGTGGGEGVGFINSNTGFDIGTPPTNGLNYSATMLTIVTGLPGCGDGQFEVVLTGIMPPKVTLSNFDLCDGDKVLVDTGYRIHAKDKFTTLTWGHNGTGNFTADEKKYEAGANETITQFTLKATKTFTLYNNTPEKYEHSNTGDVHLYKEPNFSLLDENNHSYTHDTLCLSESDFIYQRDWVDGNFDAANYTKDHLITSKSIGLTGTFPNFVMTDGLNVAQFIVSTDFGNCTKWDHVKKTIDIIRLREMTGSFDIASEVCENGILEITNVTVDPMAANYLWKAEGGSIDQTDLQKPIFTAATAGDASVSLIVVPPHDCTDSADIPKPVTIKEKPSLVLRDTTICEESDLVLTFDRHPQIKSISWKVNGREFASTTIETTVTYPYTLSDISDGQVVIIAEITPELPCTDHVFSNEITVAYQVKPQIGGDFTTTVCQGDTLSLDMITVANQSSVLWSLESSVGNLWNGDQIEAKYAPGENFGTKSLKITARGLNRCAETSQLVSVTVNESPLPSINVPNTGCVGSEIKFSNNVENKPNAAKGEWFVNEVKKSDGWYNYKATFTEHGEYRLRFTTTYNDICPRSTIREFTVNPLPEVDFISQPDSIVGSGKEITFTNQTPGTIIHYQWDFQGKGTTISDEGGVHTHRFDLPPTQSHDMVDIKLTIKDGNSCENSKVDRIKIVGKPVVGFEIVSSDNCTGSITFRNVSVAENATFHWDMGNGVTCSDTVPKDFAYTPILKDSAYYIKLTVINDAGEDYFWDTVKMISLLNPKFIIGPNKGECEKRDIGFSNRSQGDADLYTFSWGDGSPDGVYSEFSPSSIPHRYTNESTGMKKFYITLTATNTCHTKTYRDSVLVYPNQFDAAFLPDITRICFGNEISFQNKSIGFGPDVQAQWLFEGMNNPVVNNTNEVIHRFNKPGEYPVRLVMTDRCNNDTSAVVNINILGDISLDFTMKEGLYCTRQKIEMKVLPELRNKFTGYRWDFQDGYPNTDNVDSVQQNYTLAGEYQVKLTAKSISEGNCPVTTKAKDIVIHKTPYADIVPTDQTVLSGCAPYLVEKISRVGVGNELIYWDFGNGETSTEWGVDSIRYQDAGEYTVKLRLTSAEGCVDTAIKKVVVKKTPLPSFDVSDTLFCTSNGNIQIGLQNKTPEPNLSSFEWSYNQQLQPFSRGENPGVLDLSMFGEIKFKLRATNQETACSAEAFKKVISGHAFHLNLELDTLFCDEEPVEMKSLNEDAQEILWDLGDGTQETHHSFAYIYPQPGQYALKVKGENETGCKDTIIKTITVYPLPQADFSYIEDHMALEELKLPAGIDISQLPDIKNGILRFTNTSTIDKFDFSSGKTTAFWNFGDDSPALLVESPIHRFPNNGSYEVQLVVKGDHGCADSVSQLISIDLVKGLFIPNAFVPGTDKNENPGLALFQPKGIGLLSYKVQVYDEWGTCVWSSDKLHEGRPAEAWDGLFNGQVLPKGVYTWKIDAIFLDGTVWEGENGKTNGRVILIR